MPVLAPRTTGHTPNVAVVVGTDHHPFGRLIGWVNDWLAQHPEQIAGFFVQAGATPVTPTCTWSATLGIDELGSLLDTMDVLVCHGGPASISEAWRRGQVPIVVPRLQRLGEHVDDHQLDFAIKIAQLGRIRLAQTFADFVGLLEEASCDLSGFRASGIPTDVDKAVARFGALVDELTSRQPRTGPTRWRLVRSAGSSTAAAASNLPPGISSAPHSTPASSSRNWAGPVEVTHQEES